MAGKSPEERFGAGAGLPPAQVSLCPEERWALGAKGWALRL